MKPITNPKEILKLAQKRKCVYNSMTGKPIPAAFVQNYQFTRVMAMVGAGILFVYRKKK